MATPLHSRDIARVVQELGQRVRQIESGRRADWQQVVSSGSPALDRILPAGGFQRGSLVEWLCEGTGSGATTLALVAAAQAARAGGAVVVVDHQRAFYPPAAVALGIPLERLVVVHPDNRPDHLWALDQVLRSRGVAAVWCRPPGNEDHAWRRWQLAAEASGVLGLLARAAAARDEPSWAELRLWVEPIAQPERQPPARARRLRVEVLRLRGGRAGQSVELELPHNHQVEHQQAADQQTADQQAASAPHDVRSGSKNHETRAMHLAARVAAAKAGRRSRGA